MMALFGALGSGLYGQPFNESFDGATFPPAGWAIFDNAVGTATSWTQVAAPTNSGAGAAYIDFDCSVSSVSEDWLVTPLTTITSLANNLSWYHFQPDDTDWGSLYILKVSTNSQTNPADFVAVDTIFETDVPDAGYGQVSFDLSAYMGQSIYIAIVHEQDCGDEYFIDDISLSVNCPQPADTLVVSNVTQTTADLSWMAQADDVQLAVTEIGQAITPLGPPTSATPQNVTGLMPATAYGAYYRNTCPSPVPLMITGIFDGPLPGGLPKGVELFVLDSIADLSDFGISSTNNGSGTTAPNPEYTFAGGSALPGDFIYVTADSAAFADYFNFNADYITSAMFINGDDAVELYQDSVVVDVYGDVNTDGSGEPWDYLDGWAYRMPDMAPNGGLFDTLNWTYSGINAVDGCSTNDSCSSTIPIGTYTTDGVVFSPWTGPSRFTTLCPAQISGDSAATAIPVTTFPASLSGNSSVCYTDQIGNISADVWFKVPIDPCTDSLFVSLCGSAYDTYLRVYDDSLNLIDENDDSGPFCAGLTSSLIIGPADLNTDTVYVVVEGFSSDAGQYSLFIDLFTPPAPMPSLSYPADTLCEGSPEIIPNVSLPGGFFTLSDTNLTFNDSTGGLTPDLVGSFQIAYTVGDPGCSGADTVNITVIPVEDASLFYAADTICDTLVNPIPMVNTSGGTFSISSPGVINPMTGEIDLSQTPGNTSYGIVYTTSGLCNSSDSTSIYIQTCLVGIEDGLGDRFAIFPNPNSGRFQVQNLGLDLEAALEVMDMMGKVVYRNEATFFQGQSQIVELEGITEGTYFVRILSADGNAVYKLNIQRR